MSMFQYMDDIWFEEYESFLREVDNKRRDLYAVDRNLIASCPEKIENIENFQLKNGRFDVKTIGGDVPCFFYRKPGKTLYVTFTAWTENDETVFHRWSYYSWIEGSMLSISDPMLGQFRGLKLGWFYGTEELNLRPIIAEIVEVIAKKLGVANQDIVFWGSSAGGSPAIECASLLSGATALVCNPQIILKEYSYADEFEKITGIDLTEDNIGHRNNVIYHIRNCTNSKYIIMVNIREPNDMLQVKNLCEQLHIKLKYGINTFKHYIIWLYDAEGGVFSPHNMQEFPELNFIFQYVWRHFDTIVKSGFGDASRLINEFWHTYWEQRTEIAVKEILNRRTRGKKVVVFGTGFFLEYLSKEHLHISRRNYYGIEFAIDNDKNKSGQLFSDILPIVHTSEVINWEELFVIITTDTYYEEITRQLEELGLVYGVDFVLWSDLAKMYMGYKN